MNTDPARTRMLCCLLDGHARTSTELAAVAQISRTMASVHLARLLKQGLIKTVTQGKYRYYSLGSERVAKALVARSVFAGKPHAQFVSNTPVRLRAARTCYDHMAGHLAVELHDRLMQQGWLAAIAQNGDEYRLTERGTRGFEDLGIDLQAAANRRRRFACACLDWSERRPHLGGALGAALLRFALQHKWVVRGMESRALRVTPAGRRQMRQRFGLSL